MYIYMYIGGWGVSPTGKSFRFVRACEAVCERERERFSWLGPRPISVVRAVASPSPGPCASDLWVSCFIRKVTLTEAEVLRKA